MTAAGPDRTRLDDTVAIVTGAAGGLGRAITARLVAGGARVLATDRAGSGVTALPDVHGAVVAAVEVDLTADDAPEKILDAAREAFGAVHVLVNNAGINLLASLRRTDDDHFDTTMAINVRALFRLTRSTVEVMRAQGSDERHAIVNIASVNGMGAYSGAHAYAVSKAGVIGFTRSSARELGRHGIRVNAVAPGLIRTPMTHHPDGTPHDWVGDQVAGIPLQRMGEPSDVADVVAFLASRAAAYVSAQGLTVDGGGLPEM